MKRLASELHGHLQNLELLASYSQNKDELILGFGNQQKTFLIRANLDPAISLLSFPDSLSRSGKNSIDLFEEVIDYRVEKVHGFQYERSISLDFENGFQLILKLHARRGNILLAKDDQVIKIFRNSLKNDLEIRPSQLHNTIELSAENLALHDHDPLSLIPALGKESKIFLEDNGFYETTNENKWHQFQSLLELLHSNPIYLINANEPRISLLEKSGPSTTSAVQATEWLYTSKTKLFFFEKEKQNVISSLKQKIKRSENYISKTTTKLHQLEKQRSPEEIANILMANLNALQQGLSKAVLYDFYTDQAIEIKLNTKLTPQKNAENYYRKAKNIHQEITQLKKNIEDKRKLIDKHSRQVLQLEDAEDFKTLKGTLRELGLKQKTISGHEHLPYHIHELDGWMIMVGKNAKANDELTLKVAKKNDLWLHAKDVSGSHVVVKHHPGQNFPKYIIEAAAALAAHHSKRQTDSLCPVIYTEKKFVRKVKGTPFGQVVVEKEAIVMVVPKSSL